MDAGTGLVKLRLAPLLKYLPGTQVVGAALEAVICHRHQRRINTCCDLVLRAGNGRIVGRVLGLESLWRMPTRTIQRMGKNWLRRE